MTNEPTPKTAMKPTLGLTGLTVNGMALIAPGAFLWLTYQEQALYGAPSAGSAMWFGFLMALLLCYATAVCYSELARLYPGAGSSYLFAEQAFLSKAKAFRFARVIKFFTGWNSHLYYWVYPGVMVGVTALLGGYLMGYLFPDTFSSTYNSPLFMYLFCVVFGLAVSYIAYRGISAATVANLIGNTIQIVALVIFSIIAIAYRSGHPQGSTGFHLSNGVAVNYQVAQKQQLDANNKPMPVLDAAGNPTKNPDGTIVYQMIDAQDDSGNPVPADAKGNPTTLDKAAPFTLDYTAGWTKDSNGNAVFNYHPDAGSVVAPHGFSWIVVQAGIAILCLCGFESITSLGEEARDAKRHIPWAVLIALTIQGGFCYLFEYFGANYFLNNGYTLPTAGGSSAPIGDMMVITGTWLFGSFAAGRAFMLIEAATVFIALVGTTLACLNTGARITYAMGRDEEVGSAFGALHGKHLTPHRAIWVLCFLSIVIGWVVVTTYLAAWGTPPAPLDKHNIWYSFGIFSPAFYAVVPNSFLTMSLVSTFGMNLLYMTTCFVSIVAFHEHHMFNGFKHLVIPILGVAANFLVLLFYLVGPFSIAGMSWHESYIAFGVALVWAIFGYIYLNLGSKKTGKTVILAEKPATA
jgi:basic amino acid/polyamine antiporter, APA family